MDIGALTTKVDLLEFQCALAELSAGLKTVNVRERFPDALRIKLKDAMAGIGIEECAKLSIKAADRAGHFTCKIIPAGPLQDALTTVRALKADLYANV